MFYTILGPLNVQASFLYWSVRTMLLDTTGKKHLRTLKYENKL